MKAFPKDSDGRFMDFRDYLAGQALPAVMTKYPNTDFVGASELAYQYADAMLLIRGMDPANYGDEA